MEIVEEVNTVKGDVRIFRVPDTGASSPLASDHLVKVLGEGWEIHRWWFFDEFELEKAKRFGVRLLYDSEFQNKSRRGEAAWRQIHDLYCHAEEKIAEQFLSRDLLDFSPSDFEAEMRAKWAKHELWSLLSESYLAISRIIDNFGLSGEELDPYLNRQLEAASSTAAMINESNDISIKDIRPRHRWLEYRGNEPARWVMEDADHAEFVRMADLYLGEYRPVIALIAPGELQDFIKDRLDWDKTHRSWNEDRECWEVDLNSIEYTIETFQQNHFTLRIWDPVAQMLDIDKPPRPSALRPERMLPTMILEDDFEPTSATDFLIIPGLTPDQPRNLLQEEFQGLPDLAYSSVATIAETEDISISMACAVKEGALAAVGEQKPAAVQIAADTPLSLSEAQREIEGLASSGVPPSEVVDALVCMCQSDIFDFDSISNRDLYYLYDAGFCSTEEILTASMAELADTYLISRAQAEAIQEEAKDYVGSQ